MSGGFWATAQSLVCLEWCVREVMSEKRQQDQITEPVKQDLVLLGMRWEATKGFKGKEQGLLGSEHIENAEFFQDVRTHPEINQV